jgi:hypothetical protein
MALAAGAALVAVSGVSQPSSASVTGPRAYLRPAAGKPAPRAGASQRAGYGNPSGHDYVPPPGRAADTSHPSLVIGNGTHASCTSAAVVAAVAKGGVITFNCGPKPDTIWMTATAKVMNTSHRVVIDGGGKITLNGGGKLQILYMNTCDKSLKITASVCTNQQWPQLIVQNMTFQNGNSTTKQSAKAWYGGGGGGAIFDLGGQLRVVNSGFIGNSCYQYGPDLGGAGIRAFAQWQGNPIYITHDTFRGGRCSNGGALSSIGVSWVVINSLMTDNSAIGYGQNPAEAGAPGGGSGGAIYADGDSFSLKIEGTVIQDNQAREGGGAIFFVSNKHSGTLLLKDSAFKDNPSGVFWTRRYPGIYYHSSGNPTVFNTRIS